jgi:hypothetical protein
MGDLVFRGVGWFMQTGIWRLSHPGNLKLNRFSEWGESVMFRNVFFDLGFLHFKIAFIGELAGCRNDEV